MSTRFDAISGLTTVEVVADALPIPTVYRVMRWFAVLRRLLCHKCRMTMCLPLGLLFLPARFARAKRSG